ncbi:DNA repair protein RAD52 homolog isoform X1 [Athalia rosae]|uniref:DNA repair protein RAD52 homolog isoform X1 n=1 Tax=Athalia rosae TaxID=37344 RepID=UPI002033A13B|nr:DNA repair protein RAD52 homolog isoform X1 [Athalia rosae]
MNHPSCIKMPAIKESAKDPSSSNTREISRVPEELDTGFRDQLCTKNDLITIANETFGNNKWSHFVTNQTLDFVEYVTGKYHVGCATFVKVQLSNGITHEDLGYSNSSGTNKGLVIFSARTSSITNALRNTLLYFGGEVAIKIRALLNVKNETYSVISAIGEPQKIVINKNPTTRITPPACHSTPEKAASILMVNAPAPSHHVNHALDIADKRSSSPTNSEAKEIGGLIEKDVITTEEERKRLERKRRQKEKQEEYRKLLKSKQGLEKPNPRY